MEEKEIKVMKKILGANDEIASQLRRELSEKEIFYLNLMSSPGSGKTTLITKTAEKIKGGIFVIEGDIQTTLDAERITNAGIGAYQINTGPFGGDCHLESSWIKNALNEINLENVEIGDCHLESSWIKNALNEINLENVEILFVENIGNLVCRYRR